MVNPVTGRYLIIAGCGIALVGLVVYFFHDKLHWIGHLPGDIRIEKTRFRFYFPVATLLLISLLVNLFIRIAHRIFH